MSNYDELVELCNEFRRHAEPDFSQGPADYTDEAMAAQIAALPDFRKRLESLETSGWPVSEQVDYEIVRGEMNGMAFDHRVLRPWKRNPSFYATVRMGPSDVPKDEVAHVSDVLRHYKYEFPLSAEARREYQAKLKRIPGLLEQAKQNLDQDAKDMYFFGIRQKHSEVGAFEAIIKQFGEVHPELVPDVEKAKAATEDMVEWLEKRHHDMPDSYDGIGVENFDWYMANVHFVPFTWQEQRNLVRRELERSWTSMALEEQRNRALPPLAPAATREEAQARSTADRQAFFDFLRENIFTVPDYMQLGDQVGEPQKAEDRCFFSQCLCRDYLALRCHDIHWLELQREERNTHPIRHRPPMYNLWEFRSEGLATAFEETMLQAGFLDQRPRAREITYVLVAFRAARALAGMKLQSREWTLQQAIDYTVAKTPRGWLKSDGGLILGDLGLYLQQPGYGTSYVVGKVQFDRLIAECACLRGEKFNLKKFFDEYFSLSTIPASLIRWEMTGSREPMFNP
ncbi:MAG: DUF885 family protein [Kiritimatiellia bacterium]|jgi:uncharacterized protein (DUF885 family)|nr:DUF885 family protein [Kiritimatiellia bacterium]